MRLEGYRKKIVKTMTGARNLNKSLHLFQQNTEPCLKQRCLHGPGNEATYSFYQVSYAPFFLNRILDNLNAKVLKPKTHNPVQ